MPKVKISPNTAPPRKTQFNSHTAAQVVDYLRRNRSASAIELTEAFNGDVWVIIDRLLSLQRIKIVARQPTVYEWIE